MARWVEAGPDLAEDGVVRWRRVDLRARIEREFAVTLHERTVGKLLSALHFSRISVRPQHPQSDRRRRSFLKRVRRARASGRLAAQNKPLEIWFTDEARVGQQGTLTRIWAKRGSARERRAIAVTTGHTCSV